MAAVLKNRNVNCILHIFEHDCMYMTFLHLYLCDLVINIYHLDV